MPTIRRRFRTGTRRTGTGLFNTGWYSGSSYAPNMFNNVRRELAWRIASYRYINSQCSGAGKVTAFSPSTANRWVKWVNGGARVYKFNNTDFCRYFGTQWNNASPTACLRWMRQKYGNGIKGVTRGRGNTWLIAATTNFTARPFNNYHWH